MTSAHHVPRAQWVALGALAALGVLLVASAGDTPAALRAGPPAWHALRHLLALGAGAALAWEVARRRQVDPRLGWLAVGILAAALLATLTPLGVFRGGARRGVGVVGCALQPSVLLAAVAPAVCARWLATGRAPAVAAALLAACAVCVLQPNFAHLGLLLAVVAASTAGAGRWRAAAGALGLGVVAALIASSYPYVRWRVASFLAASLTADTRGLAGVVREASPWGAGLGRGSWKALLSSAPSDYVFAVGLEELGALGALGAALLLVGSVLSLGLRRAPGPERARAWGTAAFLTVPALLHAAVCLRLIPVTGIHFPLLSEDPSAALAVGLAIGLSAEAPSAVRRLTLDRANELGFEFRGVRASVRWSRAFSLELHRERR